MNDACNGDVCDDGGNYWLRMSGILIVIMTMVMSVVDTLIIFFIKSLLKFSV